MWEGNFPRLDSIRNCSEVIPDISKVLSTKRSSFCVSLRDNNAVHYPKFDNRALIFLAKHLPTTGATFLSHNRGIGFSKTDQAINDKQSS